jgi:hypothetical protein
MRSAISAITTDGMATALANTFGGTWSASFSRVAAFGQITWTNSNTGVIPGLAELAASVSSNNFSGLDPVGVPASVGATFTQGVADTPAVPSTTVINDLGADILDFTSYRAGWLGVAELDATGHVVVNTWTGVARAAGAAATTGVDARQTWPIPPNRKPKGKGWEWGRGKRIDSREKALPQKAKRFSRHFVFRSFHVLAVPAQKGCSPAYAVMPAEIPSGKTT